MTVCLLKKIKGVFCWGRRTCNWRRGVLKSTKLVVLLGLGLAVTWHGRLLLGLTKSRKLVALLRLTVRLLLLRLAKRLLLLGLAKASTLCKPTKLVVALLRRCLTITLHRRLLLGLTKPGKLVALLGLPECLLLGLLLWLSEALCKRTNLVVLLGLGLTVTRHRHLLLLRLSKAPTLGKATRKLVALLRLPKGLLLLGLTKALCKRPPKLVVLLRIAKLILLGVGTVKRCVT